MTHATIIDVDGGAVDGRVRAEYERRLSRLDRRYVFNHRTDEVRPVVKGEANEILAADGGDLALLFFEARQASAHFIGGHLYLRTNGQDQILGYSVKIPALRDLLDEVWSDALAAVEKARKREQARRSRCAVLRPSRVGDQRGSVDPSRVRDAVGT